METTGNNMSDERRKFLIDSIPEAAVVDSHKENIQPRQTGKSVSALTALYESSAIEREHDIELGHAQFQEELNNLDELDDPLDVYIRYLAWTHCMYPQGQTSESNLVGLYHDATDKFKLSKKYKFDPRYLKIWIEYSKLVQQPKDIFIYLIKSDIGQNLSMFYEEYAFYYERLSKYDDAAQVFERGIEKEAEPLARLNKSFALFKARTEERRQRGLIKKQEHEAKVQMESLRATGCRTMLGHKFDSKSRVSVPANVYAETQSAMGGAGSSSSTVNSSRTFGNDRPTGIGIDSSLSSSASFSVYVEDLPQPNTDNILPKKLTSFTPSSHQHPSNQSSSARTENQIPIQKFYGTTFSQGEIIRPPIAPIQVYRDSDNANRPLTRPKSNQSQRMFGVSSGTESSTSKIRKNPTSDNSASKRVRISEEERIRRNEEDRLKEENIKRLEKRFNLREHLFEQSNDSKGKGECMSILEACLHEDRSVEEYRAIKLNLPMTIPKEVEYQDLLKDELKKSEKKPAPVYTAETLAAMEMVDNACNENFVYTEEEQNLTWNNPVQIFKSIVRKSTNENAE